MRKITVPVPRSFAGTRYWVPIVVVGYALFMDYLIYGAVLPLMAYTPAHVSGARELGLLSGAYAVGVLGATPFYGWLGDRVGCRQPLIQGVLLSAVATLLFALAPNFPMLIVARLAQGAAAAATWTAGLALVAEHYAGRRVEFMGYALMGSTGGSVLGPLLGGWLFEAGGYVLPFIVLLVLIAIDAAMRILLLPSGNANAAHGPGALAILRDRSVAVPALAVVLAAAGWGILEPLLPSHLSQSGSIGPAEIGLLFTISTIVYGLSAPFVSWVATRYGVRAAATAGTCMMAVFLPTLSLSDSFIPILATLCLVSVGFALLLNPSSAELGNAVERRGLACYSAVYAVYNIAYSVGMIGTSSFAAAFAARAGFLYTLLIVSAALLVCIPLMVAATPQREVMAAEERTAN